MNLQYNPSTSIVKIIAQNVTFNWYKPYKTAYEYESIGIPFLAELGREIHAFLLSQ